MVVVVVVANEKYMMSEMLVVSIRHWRLYGKSECCARHSPALYDALGQQSFIMKFMDAKVVDYKHYFLGKLQLVVPHDTSDEDIRKALDREYNRDNWEHSSLVVQVRRMKERVFNKHHTPLDASSGSLMQRPAL